MELVEFILLVILLLLCLFLLVVLLARGQDRKTAKKLEELEQLTIRLGKTVMTNADRAAEADGLLRTEE